MNDQETVIMPALPEPVITPAPPVTQVAQSTATFEILLSGIRTATVGNLTDVVKQVEWIMRGTENGQTFELSQKTNLEPPDENSFIPLESITDPTVIIAWIEATDSRINAIKGHIQLILCKLSEESSWVVNRDHPLFIQQE